MTTSLGLKRLIFAAVIHRPSGSNRYFSAKSEEGNSLMQFMEDPPDSDVLAEIDDTKPACRTWVTKEAMHVKLDMPGLGKEDVKVTMENGYLFIRGNDPYHANRKFHFKLQAPENKFNGLKVEAQMINGLLKVVVPKVSQNLPPCVV